MHSGFGMMGGRSAGSGMMGHYSSSTPSAATRLSIKQVEKNLYEYLLSSYDDSFYIEEIMEFNNNYYAQIGHQDEENLAFELIIDPYNGKISSEPGPNMMWNRSYGHMQWRFWSVNRKMTVSETEAIDAAQRYLGRFQPGMTVEPHADRFNGYYTIHMVNESGIIAGMLSVNGNNSKVWYHDWHGEYRGKDPAGLNSEPEHG